MLVFEEEKILFADSSFNCEEAFQERLQIAVMIGNPEAFSRSLKQAALMGWSLDFWDHEGYTLLMRAVKEGNTPFVKKLLESGANPFLKAKKPYKENWNALSLAAKEGHSECIKIILSHKKEGIEKEAFLAAKTAIFYGKNEALEILLTVLKEPELEELFQYLNQVLLHH